MSFHSPRYTQRNCSNSPYKEVIVPSPTHYGTPPSAPTFSQPISIPSRTLLVSEDSVDSNGFNSYLSSSSPTKTIFQHSPSQTPFNRCQHSTDVIYENEVNKFGNKNESLENVGFLFDFQLDEEIRERHQHNFHHPQSPMRNQVGRPFSAHLSSPLHVYPQGDQFMWPHSEPVSRTSRRSLYTSSSPSQSSPIHTTTSNVMHNHYSMERRTRSCSGKVLIVVNNILPHIKYMLLFN